MLKGALFIEKLAHASCIVLEIKHLFGKYMYKKYRSTNIIVLAYIYPTH